MKSGNLNFMEPSGPLQACNGTALPFFPISSSLALVAQYWGSGFDHQPGYLPFWLRRVSFSRDFTGRCQGRLFRCAPNLFSILTCSPVNALISPRSVSATILANAYIAHHRMTKAEPWLHKPQTVFFALQSLSRRQCHSTVAAEVCSV